MTESRKQLIEEVAIALVGERMAQIAGAQTESGRVALSGGNSRPMTPIELEILRASAAGRAAAIRSLTQENTNAEA